MSPPWLQTSGDDSEGRFQVLDDTESQPQTTEEWRTATDEGLPQKPSASGSELHRPVTYKSYATSSSSHATTSNGYGSTDDTYATATGSISYDSSSSAGMPTGRYGYHEDQGYQKNYQEEYEYDFQKVPVAVQDSTVYDATNGREHSRPSYDYQNYQTINADPRGYPDGDLGYDSALATSKQSYNQDPESNTVDDAADAGMKSANPQDDERYRREYEAERHRRSRQKSSRHRRR
ncbi:Ff.00g013280.m01.CDS01 [Fusarium sp. VM40]|nr:Ff.00g013280.m01.CDS01 [Fusarium sp. VM40]